MELNKFNSIALWVIGVILGLMILIIIFISPITKYLVEKYDVAYTGREIKMDWAYVNPFTGYVHFDDLKVYEFESDTVFLSVAGLSLNFEIFKAISGEYEIAELTLNKPWAKVVQHDTLFNFSDMLEKFAPKEAKKDTAEKEAVKFSLLNVKIEKGEFHFHEKTIPIVYFIKNVEMESTGLRWDHDTTAVKLAFESGVGSGKITISSKINMATMDHASKVLIEQFNLNLLAQYLQEISNYGTLAALLDADVVSTGNFNDPKKTDARVKLDISDFRFGKTKDNDYVSFDNLKVRIKQISPSEGIFFYDSIALTKPYFKYERYDSLDNIQTTFGINGEKVKQVNADQQKFNLILEIVKYFRQLTENLLNGQYTLNSLVVTDGNLIYNDYTPREKFSLAANPFNLQADHIDKTKNHGSIKVQTGLKPHGVADIFMKVYPKNLKDFDVYYHLDKVPLTAFNPFIVTATSYPLDRGSLELKGHWDVKNGHINSENRLTLIDPRTGDRVKKKDTRWVPVPLVFAILRERGNVIDYEIPITGDLNNPKFNVWDPILDVLGNIFIKPPTLPYGLHVRNVENKLGNTIHVKWDYHGQQLTEGSKPFFETLVDFLKDNPDATLDIHPQLHEEKEKEFIVMYEAKKLYYLLKNKKNNKNFTTEDSLKVEKMDNKQPGFLAYLNKRITDPLLFTIQHKSLNVVGEDKVNAEYASMHAKRKNHFISYFPKEQRKRLTFHPIKSEVPFNAQSLYEISYKGKVPEKLKEEYRRYQNLNDDFVRGHFKKKRKFREVFF